MTGIIIKKQIFDVYLQILVWLMSYLLKWRQGEILWLQSATRRGADQDVLTSLLGALMPSVHIFMVNGAQYQNFHWWWLWLIITTNIYNKKKHQLHKVLKHWQLKWMILIISETVQHLSGKPWVLAFTRMFFDPPRQSTLNQFSGKAMDAQSNFEAMSTQGCLGRLLSTKPGTLPYYYTFDIHINARTPGFAANFCTVARWSNIFTSTIIDKYQNDHQ